MALARYSLQSGNDVVAHLANVFKLLEFGEIEPDLEMFFYGYNEFYVTQRIPPLDVRRTGLALQLHGWVVQHVMKNLSNFGYHLIESLRHILVSLQMRQSLVLIV